MTRWIKQLSDPRVDETKRVEATRRVLGRYLQSPISADATLKLFDMLAEKLVGLKGSGRMPPRPNDLVFTDQVIVVLSELYGLMAERLEQIAYVGKTAKSRGIADKIIQRYGLDGQEHLVYDSIRDAEFEDLLDLLNNMTHGYDFLLGRQASQLYKKPHSDYLDASSYLMSRILRAISRRLGEVTQYTPPMP